jgi:hypothetical protein
MDRGKVCKWALGGEVARRRRLLNRRRFTVANTETRRRPSYRLATDGAGKYAAFSEVEPAFWVDGNSDAEVRAAAEAIIRDYAERFGRPMKAARPASRNLAVHQFSEREVA